MLHSGRHFFCRTVIRNRLSSDTCDLAQGKVIERLDWVFKLVKDLLIGGRDYTQLAERVETLAGTKVQVGTKMSFAGYIIDRNTQ